ncbi:MAG: hypothetical protein GX254_02095 [Clostridiales bacterium]|jgi:hypothetical protein|nr:hypothetical protein [Clostridiales bacterium]
MSISRIKTIVIFILLIVNVCLLAIYFVDKYDDMVLGNQTRSALVDFLEAKGISMNEDRIPNETKRDIYYITRDIEMERGLVEAVLGSCEAIDQGGYVYLYKSKNGNAEFRSTGRFDITINKYPTGSKSIEKVSEELLDLMGLDAIRDTSEGLRSDEIKKVGYICLHEEDEVFNCRINFTYHADGRVEISGNKIVGKIGYLRQADMLSIATVLVSFAREAENTEGISRIESIKPGYMMSANAAELQPVWRIITDCGYYYIDAATGTLRVI